MCVAIRHDRLVVNTCFLTAGAPAKRWALYEARLLEESCVTGSVLSKAIWELQVICSLPDHHKVSSFIVTSLLFTTGSKQGGHGQKLKQLSLDGCLP